MFSGRKSTRRFSCLPVLLPAVALAALILTITGVQPVLAQKWVYAANPMVNRDSHTATRLQDGKVLVTGGFGSAGLKLQTCQLYDPATDTWATVGDLKLPRASHTATLLDDGTVLVAGGGNPTGSQKDSELYNPVSQTWEYTNGNLVTPRDAHTATLLSGSRVLVAGGQGLNDAAKKAEIYNPTSKTWASTGGLQVRRYRHTAVLLDGDKVLISGGMDTSPLKSNEIFTEPNWSLIDDLVTPRTFQAAVRLGDGRALVAGGYSPYNVVSTEVYNPGTDIWDRKGDLGSARAFFTLTLLPSGKVLAAGGEYMDADHYSHYRNSAELYDPVKNEWSLTSPLNEERGYHTATLLLDGRVLVVGGSNLSGKLASAELYGANPGGSVGTFLLLLD
jgi:N-acetylneuraminic acid mutarotase